MNFSDMNFAPTYVGVAYCLLTRVLLAYKKEGFASKYKHDKTIGYFVQFSEIRTEFSSNMNQTFV